ncbi:hypothetical protein F2P81_002357 [Scophthalmus maximus]|uniref:Uncharacterized protein n=1 Tax=Scophthalmus maximus TaxID=52904 RepID=A0A6A4TN77_SCOMX|nr:hypothetical protein F2P81_002357 [Scophthalmus maximus]
MSRRSIPPRRRGYALLSPLPSLGKKGLNHQQVQVYVLLAQLFTSTANVLQDQSFVTVNGISAERSTLDVQSGPDNRNELRVKCD